MWDGTEYECISYTDANLVVVGNKHIEDNSADDTGEPFYIGDSGFDHSFAYTNSNAAAHIIGISKETEAITPMAEEFLPNIPADKLPTGAITTLHINVTAVNMETMEATFTADKTPSEMQQASINGPIWCVITFAAGVISGGALSLGIPPAWNGINTVAFGSQTLPVHDQDGRNDVALAVWGTPMVGWTMGLTAFAGD